MLDYETILYRYKRNYITDEQLSRCVRLGLITETQSDDIKSAKTAKE